MSTVTLADLERCALRVSEPVHEIVERLHGLRRLAVAALDVDPVTSGTVAALRPAVQAALAQSPGVNGLGLVMAPGALADASLHLEWWRAMPDGTAQPLHLELDPASESFYDYPEREWFRGPADGGVLGVSGPYVDYRGADEYVFTFAVPVVVGGRFLGVAGADYPLALLEERVLGALRSAGPGVVLVNREQRVIAGGSARWRPGERLRPPAVSAQALVAATRVRVEPAETGWSVMDLTDALDR